METEPDPQIVNEDELPPPPLPRMIAILRPKQLAKVAEMLASYAIQPGHGGIYTITRPDGTAYTVNPAAPSCNCQSHRHGTTLCKHVVLLKVIEEWQEGDVDLLPKA